jgi:hypothetical protein
MSENEFYAYLLTLAGINAAILFILSFVADAWDGFVLLAPKTKRFIVMGLSFLIPVGATLAMGNYSRESVFAALFAGFVAYYGSQARNGVTLSADRQTK